MGNTDEVKELLKNGAHVNEQNEVRMNLENIDTQGSNLTSFESLVIVKT